MGFYKQDLSLDNSAETLKRKGFAIIDEVFAADEIQAIEQAIALSDHSRKNFRKEHDLYAVRQFFKEIPELIQLVFTDRFKHTIGLFFGANTCFVVKSIYFDKPAGSNWFVAYHQDLTISVQHKHQVEGFGPWSQKQGQYAVQPPLSILQTGLTIRIHLDDTNELNGALRVVPYSHLKGIYRPETIDWCVEREEVCQVNKGSVMVMKPLLLHASSRTVNNQCRRVLHIEFNCQPLPHPLQWSEYLEVPA
jgi:ectoine hydroxylase-related dioxygenase (phytanoyl-CoA dioxygenase family)